MKKFIVALVLTSAFIFLLAACGGDVTPAPVNTQAPPTKPPAPTSALVGDTPEAPTGGICAQGTPPTFLRGVVLTTNTTGTDFKPVDQVESYASNQGTFHAVVTLATAPQNTKMRAAWYVVNAPGYVRNSKISESEFSLDSSRTGNFDFTLKPEANTWPPGTYCLEVYANSALALSKIFTVTSAKNASNATTAVVKQIVLAPDVKPDTFEPINPTTMFAKNAPAIHAALQIEKAPPNTVFRARWYPPNQEPLDFEHTADNTRWLDFQLTPSADGFPAGEYKVEIYVNDQLADTKPFTVQ